MKGNMRKALVRTFHLATGWIVCMCGYCPHCLNEVLGGGGESCPVCFSSMEILGRREVFRRFKARSDSTEKDVQLFLCPQCGASWVWDNYLYLWVDEIVCPECGGRLPALREEVYNFVVMSCNHCGMYHVGAVANSFEWIQCRACHDKIPAPATPLEQAACMSQ